MFYPGGCTSLTSTFGDTIRVYHAGRRSEPRLLPWGKLTPLPFRASIDYILRESKYPLHDLTPRGWSADPVKPATIFASSVSCPSLMAV